MHSSGISSGYSFYDSGRVDSGSGKRALGGHVNSMGRVAFKTQRRWGELHKKLTDPMQQFCRKWPELQNRLWQQGRCTLCQVRVDRLGANARYFNNQVVSKTTLLHKRL